MGVAGGGVNRADTPTVTVEMHQKERRTAGALAANLQDCPQPRHTVGGRKPNLVAIHIAKRL